MAQKSRKRHPAAEVLLQLALNGETSQPDLADKVSYRTLVRVLQQLQKGDLIYLSFRRPAEFKGAPSNCWSLTFAGIRIVLKWKLAEEEVDRLVASYPDSNWIFRKWGYIKQNVEVKKWVISQMALYETPFSVEAEFDKNLGKGVENILGPGFPHLEKHLQNQREEDRRLQFLYQVLGAEFILGGGLFAEVGDEGFRCRSQAAEYVEYLMKEPVLKKIYNSLFERIEAQYRMVQKLRKTYSFTN